MTKSLRAPSRIIGEDVKTYPAQSFAQFLDGVIVVALSAHLKSPMHQEIAAPHMHCYRMILRQTGPQVSSKGDRCGEE